MPLFAPIKPTCLYSSLCLHLTIHPTEFQRSRTDQVGVVVLAFVLRCVSLVTCFLGFCFARRKPSSAFRSFFDTSLWFWRKGIFFRPFHGWTDRRVDSREIHRLLFCDDLIGGTLRRLLTMFSSCDTSSHNTGSSSRSLRLMERGILVVCERPDR